MFYYHLTLEIYNSPDQQTDTKNLPQSLLGFSEQISQQSYIPKDIFDKLPANVKKPHKTSKSKSQPKNLYRKSHQEKVISTPSQPSPNIDDIPEIPPTPAPSDSNSLSTSSHSTLLTSSSRSAHQKRRSEVSSVEPHKLDFRFGNIEIEWMDNNYSNNSGTSGMLGTPASSSSAAPSSSSIIPERTIRPIGTIVPTSGTTSLNYGILHLYREAKEIPKESEPGWRTVTKKKKNEDEANPTAEQVESSEQDIEQDIVLAVLAVPSTMSASDFLHFVAPVNRDVSHYRMIRDASINKYMVVMKFRDPKSAFDFYTEYNGRSFSSMEPEICHVVYIKSIEFKSTSTPPYTSPFFQDSFFPEDIENINSNDLYELPTCPVCLERMDASVTGLLTILCQHTFHCGCLAKWGDSSCPVCRYSSKSHASTDLASQQPQLCEVCGAQENLWICLICGHIGCGRYQEAHAYSHYMDTSHLYALEIETQRVWDYAGDGYVHRLIQSDRDGKLVQLDAHRPSEAQDTRPGGEDKMDATAAEYTYLLTTMLDSQRSYYEDQIETFMRQIDGISIQVKQLLAEVGQHKQDKEAMEKKVQAVLMEQKQLETENAKIVAKLNMFKEQHQKSLRELNEERALNSEMRKNQNDLKKNVEEKEKTVADLKEEVRDLMFFVQSRDKLAGTEVEGGEVIGVAAGKKKSKKKK